MNQDTHWNYTVNEWQRPQFAELLTEAFTQNPEVIYDIGACVGGWAYIVFKMFGKKSICFEPFKDNVDYMHARGELNDIGVEIKPFGIWYGAEKAELSNRQDDNVGGQFIREVDNTGIPSGVFCDFKTLEDFPLPDLIKLDVEGAELNIIEHSTRLKEVPQIIVEWHYENGPSAIDAEEFFAKHLPHKVVSKINNGMFLLRL